jgi:hypothetical protein
MTVMKRLSKPRKAKIRHAIEKAFLAMGEEIDEPEIALRAIDDAMKLFNTEDDYAAEGLRYDELNDACEAFLEQSGLPTLTVALLYIENWRKQEKRIKELEARLAQASPSETH